jgi:hypothetical protein
MLGEVVRVTKPDGRVAAIVHACDRPFLMNLPPQPALHRKVEEPSGWAPGAELRGCADASLYQHFQQAGLIQVQMFPQWDAFDRSATVVIQFLQNRLPTLSPAEAQEWQRARAQAEAEGTFFIAWPHHSALGTKP